jgi:uncharacterized membrane protein YgaE (UPF0421/DUF939 family)
VGNVREELARRARRWLRTALPIAQCAVAAGLAWLVAAHIPGHERPFFAPIAAVVSLNVSLGQRLRRVVELVVGVSVGVGVGDLLISVIGSGPWQIALVVALAMSTAVLLDSGAMIAAQAGSSAVLVATLLPPSEASGLGRMLDALIGGVVGLAVAALLPANPLTVARRHAKLVIGELAIALRGVATAIAEHDVGKAATVLARARGSQRAIEEFRSALEASGEIARIAPIRWRHRDDLHRYRNASASIDYALRNTRVLIRRALAALRNGEPVPEALSGVLAQLADAADLLRDELAEGERPLQARDAVRRVAEAASDALLNEGGFSIRVVVAQLRSIAVDLLQATGLSRDEAVATLPSLAGSRTDVSSG